jgi:ketosteroid isomerase-like protein
MKKTPLLLFCLLIINLLHAQTLKKRYTEKDVFDIEMQFSKASLEKGFRSANLVYAADSSFCFRPRLMNARQWAEGLKVQDSSYSITWYPSFIDMSEAGDLGYATGPFDNVSTIPGDSAANHGQFVTVWKRQPDGSLKFIMDFGSGPLSKKEWVQKEPLYYPVVSGSTNYGKTNIQKNKNEVLRLEQDLSLACQTIGDFAAYQKFASEDIRFFYQRQFYARGLQQVKQRLEKQTGSHSFKVLDLNVAESGDLAHVYGTLEFLENGKIIQGYYMRIWKKQPSGGWTVVVQVRNLL